VIDPVYYNINSLAKVLYGGIIKNAMNPDNEDKPVPRHLTEWKKRTNPYPITSLSGLNYLIPLMVIFQ
jgi:hypothetical protein